MKIPVWPRTSEEFEEFKESLVLWAEEVVDRIHALEKHIHHVERHDHVGFPVYPKQSDHKARCSREGP